jgi:hypothetical protein
MYVCMYVYEEKSRICIDRCMCAHVYIYKYTYIYIFHMDVCIYAFIASHVSFARVIFASVK